MSMLMLAFVSMSMFAFASASVSTLCGVCVSVCVSLFVSASVSTILCVFASASAFVSASAFEFVYLFMFAPMFASTPATAFASSDRACCCYLALRSGAVILVAKGRVELAVQRELYSPQGTHVYAALGKARIKGFDSLRLPNGLDAIHGGFIRHGGRCRLGHHSRFDHVGWVCECRTNQRTRYADDKILCDGQRDVLVAVAVFLFFCSSRNRFR
mmetsp:Transcript_4815/g.10193  ORF Transcript_4815/g.10193 Transcript_4815/m.10193 type:complete len:214 (-) Transcript_4815:43-684(-)